MKTMNDYTVYCTEEQTKRAYKLGAPIKKDYSIHFGVKSVRISPEHECSFYATIPTTQQMIGWLREKGADVFHWLTPIMIDRCPDLSYEVNNTVSDYKTAELAAINAALDYLKKGE